MKLTKEQLYQDLHLAYLKARRHKRSRDYQQRFERDMYWQLKHLCDELYDRRYEQQPATCFTIYVQSYIILLFPPNLLFVLFYS